MTSGANGNVQFADDQPHHLLRIPLSPSGIRTTPDYYRRPILLHCSDLSNGNTNFSSSSTLTNDNNLHNGAPHKQALALPKPGLFSCSNVSKVGGHPKVDKVQSCIVPPHQQPPPKSKLSVSFSNSVQEYYDGKDDDDGNDDDNGVEEYQNDHDSETSSDNGYDENGLDKICAGHGLLPCVADEGTSSGATFAHKSTPYAASSSRNQLRTNEPESTTTARLPILRTISTKVQVHVSSNKKGCDNETSDPTCFYGNGNVNCNNNHCHNARRTVCSNNSSSIDKDSHGQTNLMSKNDVMNVNEPATDPNNGSNTTNGILKCHVETTVPVARVGCSTTSDTFSKNSLYSRKEIGETGDNKTINCVDASVPTTGTVAAAPMILPSPTSVNQDQTRNCSGSSSNSDKSSSSAQNVGDNKSAEVSASLSSSPLAAAGEAVGSGPEIPTIIMTASVPSLGKLHVSICTGANCNLPFSLLCHLMYG